MPNFCSFPLESRPPLSKAKLQGYRKKEKEELLGNERHRVRGKKVLRVQVILSEGGTSG